MKKTIIFIMILIILFTLPHVSAIDENSTDLISATNDNEVISSDNEYINYDPDTEFTLEINDTKDYETTGNITFYLYFNGTLSFGPEIYDFEKNPITIYENNNNVGTVPVDQINYTTFNQGGNNVFNATFTLPIQNKTQIRLHYTAWDTNTLTIEKILEPELKALTTQTIIIRDKKGIKYTSNNTWNNSIHYLKKAIDLAGANDEIILTNINIQTTPIFTNLTQTSTINVNKNLKIIGNNAVINANKNGHLFEINSNVTFINMTFINFSSYLFKNHGNLTFINCTFKDSYTRFINNTGNLIILNSTFKNMKEYYSNAQISLLKDYYTEIGLIYNTGNLQIDNSVFDNFDYPKEMEIDNFTIKEHGVIYNLNSATITNTNFTNINTRAINNTGNLKLDKTLFENITTNTLNILINSSEFNEISENTIYQSYTGYREKTTYTTYGNKNYFLNGGAVYNTNNLTITESQFKNIISYYGGAIFNEGNATVNSSNFINTASSGGMGGAIYNDGKMTLENVMINNSKAHLNNIQIGKNTFIQITHGGAIYNNQTLTVNNSIITQSSAGYGGSITNNGKLIINNTILDKNSANDNNEHYNSAEWGQTILNNENGDCFIYNSNIKNTIAIVSYPFIGGVYGTYLGTIYNLGNLTITKTIFDNITGKYEILSMLAGSFTIYNSGKMNATYNYFINSPHEENPLSTAYGVHQTSYTYAYSNNPNNSYMSNNYYCLNTDPYTIDTNFPVNDYFILAFDPDYYALNLNEVRDITLKLKLASGKEFSNYELLPKANVTIYTYDENGNKINFTKELTNGQITFTYNYTSTKGRYIISAEMGGGKCIAEIDVGKNKSYMDIKAEDIYYEDNAIFIMNVTGNLTNQPTGNVSIILDGKKYTAEINNTKANLTIPNLPAKTYDLIIRYEGDEDYFKYIHHQNFTVYKKPTGIKLEIPDVYYGERAIGRIFLNTSKYSVKDGHIYITDENNQTTVNQIAIRNNTYVRLSNFASGDLKITVELIGNENYESSNATVIFKIKKYETNLTINASDINAGESETITVTLTPEGEVAGEATLKINNHTEIIFLSNGETNITIENVTGGTYYIEVYFPGDKKYAPSNATAKFTAKKLQSEITAKIEDNILYINTTPNSTGKVQIFINDDIYEENLKNSQIMFQVNFTKAENYIFIYYQGDGYYNYSTANLTYEYEDLLNLTGYDETFYNTENQTYYLTLTDEEGYGIANRTIAITLNNETSNLITGYDGSITYKLNLDAGNYTITARYKSKTITNRITVLEDAFLTTINTNAYETIDFTYTAELKNHKGNPIKDAEVTFKIGNQTYKNKTNNQGLATISLNLNEGNYQIRTVYRSLTNTNRIIVQGLILKGNNLKIYNTESGTYTVSLTKENGEGVANKEITITLNNTTYTRITDKNGAATLNISLDTGTYIIKASYNNKTITNTITVMEDAFLTTEDIKIFENTEFTFTALLKDHKDNPIKNAKVTFIFNNMTYERTTNSKGEATLNLKLKRGNYIITTTYKSIINENSITIQEFNLTGEDITIYNTQNATYHLTLKDKKGNGIANEKIIITLNNETFTVTTDDNGSASKEISLDTGKYIIQAQYNNDIIRNTITVLEDAFLSTNDTKAYDDVDFIFAVELKDHKDNPIKNAEITFKIGNETYERTTNSKGEATLNLNLKKGNYIITTTYKSIINENYITVVNLKLKAENITFYNTQNGTYYATLINDEGHGIKGKTITITFNNTIYTKTTDENGNAILKIIDLDTGNYTIEAQYKNQIITNKIIVLEDRFLSVNNTKAYENVDFTHIALLTDHAGKGVENEIITFKINGETYTNKTNKNGIAVLNLNLKEGNYSITTIFKKITKRAKIIIVDDSHLVGNDVKAYSGMNFTYQTRLTDHNNDPITDALITFKIGNETFTNKTDAKGRSTLTFNLETGNYTITANYKNLTIENNFEIIEDYIIRGNDIKAYSETNFVYKVNLTDHNGKAIRNVEMTFIVDGITYTNKTDINGQAIITLSLKTGNYTIIAKYRNTTADNTLIIIEDYILSGNDVKALAYDNFPYKVNLTDHNGKAIENAEITFVINGKTYKNTTNTKGSATITLNLPEGKYTITAKYRNTTTTNELELVENYMLTGQNIKAYEYSDFTYTITLTRTDGTPISGKTITLVMNNKKYTNTTDSEGKASKTLNLPEGNYTITAIYKNATLTNSITIIEEYNLNANHIKTYSERDFIFKANLTDHNKNPVKNAEITFEINGSTYTNKTDVNGQAVINLNLKTGNYTITTSYKNVKITNKLEIIETYQLKGINVKSYENFDFKYIVTLKNHNDKAIENAEITFDIDGKTYKNTTDENGQATITLNLKEGNYTITATYQNITTTNQLNIIKYDLEKIESTDLTMHYKDGSRFTIRITKNGTALANKTVQFTINGNTYARTTNEEGYASIAINLNSGMHNITTQYKNLSTENTITIKSTIEGNDLTKIYRNDTQYYATFYNQKGEPLKNTKITFNINGVMYERNTNENGTAKLNINLAAGRYIITAINPENGEQHSNIITVLSKIQENKDLTKYYKNASQYIVKIVDSKGNPAKAGEKVTFNINGVFYERYTNETGHVKMNINLPPGEYIITAEYEGCKVSNTIKVLPILKAQDMTMKYRDGSKFKATLLDEKGKAYPNQQVSFNINGVLYTRNTDENGIAKLNINLMPGEYIITSSYNGLNIANTVKIK